MRPRTNSWRLCFNLPASKPGNAVYSHSIAVCKEDWFSFSGLIECQPFHSYPEEGRGGCFTSKPLTLDVAAFSYSVFLFPSDTFSRCALALLCLADACFFTFSELGLTNFFSWRDHALCRELGFAFFRRETVCTFWEPCRTAEDRGSCFHQGLVEKSHGRT